MADKGEILSEAEVEFLLASAGSNEADDTGLTLPTSADGQAVTMRGDLEQINLADIFQTLGMSKMEGVLRICNPLEERQVYCRDGFVRILVPGRIATRRLGQRLIQAGVITSDQLRTALLTQRKEKRPVGELLVASGMVAQQAVDEIVGLQVAEDLFSLFTWRHGSFEFFKGQLTNDSQKQTFDRCPEFETNSLLLEVARRSDEWQSILAAIGCLDEVPVRIADPSADSELSELHRTLLDTADGRLTYRQLAEQTTFGLFDVARAARDLATGRILANIDDAAMVALAEQLAAEGAGKRVLVCLQTLRDRPGARALDVARGMAKALEQTGERRLAGNLLLEAAQHQSNADTAIDLARTARRLSPHDPATLSFLRTILVVHASPDSPELEQVTLDLLDALIDGDVASTAIEIVDDARRTGTVRAPILLREARARQKLRDVPGATRALFELAELYDAQGDRARATEAYEALLRIDRSRKDVQKLLVQRRRTRVGRIVRVAAAFISLAMMGTVGAVLWQDHWFSAAVAEADREITALLEEGERATARERLQHWQAQLGDCEPIEDLQNRIAFAEAAEAGRAQKMLRQRVNTRLIAAADLLGKGELGAALTVYRALAADAKVRDEVSDVVRTRVGALLDELDKTAKGLTGRLPVEPNTLIERRDLVTRLAELQVVCPPPMLRAFADLRTMAAGPELALMLPPDQVPRITELLRDAKEPFARAEHLVSAYTDALQRDEQQRQLDPMYKAAVEKETAHDFAGALALYRDLERLSTGDSELRTHFRDRVARNATIVRLTEALRAATEAGDFAGAQQQLRALQLSFPDIPFQRLVRLPLRILSQPAGARITCNGQDVGTAPIVLSRIPGESLKLSASAPGFKSVATTIVGDETASWVGHLELTPDVTWHHGSMLEVAPVLVGDRMFVVDRDGNVVAVDPKTGVCAWTFRSGDLSGLLTEPIVYQGKILVGSLDGDLRALDETTGKVAWSLPDLPTEVAPARVDRFLLLATTDQRLGVIDLAERTRTSVPLPDAPARLLASGRTVLVVGENGRVVAFKLPVLEPAWQQSLAGMQTPTATLAAGHLVIADDRGRIAGLDVASGEVRWQHDLGVEFLGAPAAHGRQVIVPTHSQLLRFDAGTGAERAAIERGDQDWAGPVAVVGNRLVAPLRDGQLQVLDLGTGGALYRIAAGKRARALGAGERLFVANADRSVQTFLRLR